MPAKILVVGDSYMPPDAFTEAFDAAGLGRLTSFHTIDPTRTAPLDVVTEYQGSPDEIDALLDGHEVLCVHAAPVTRALLEKNPSVKLLACGRGGPVNIDLQAAADLGVAVTTTPAKNAESVADLTVCMMIMLLRRVLPATASLRARAAAGSTHLDSTFVGGGWMAHEPRGRTLGLVGFGNIARLVAPLAHSLGMRVLAYDPYADRDSAAPLAELTDLDTLLRHSDVVSLHARATQETRHLIGRAQLAAMPKGSYLINTSRQSLLDEDALLDALKNSHLAGAALDVCEPVGRWPELAQRDDVVLTPHLGGATLETRARGARMVAENIRRFFAGEPLAHPVGVSR